MFFIDVFLLFTKKFQNYFAYNFEAIEYFCFNSKVDINGFLLMTSFVFFGLYQGIQSGAEDIYINNSIDKNLRKSTSLRIYLAESLGALFAAGFSYILVMYASPGQEQGSSTVVAWDSTMRIAYAIT